MYKRYNHLFRDGDLCATLDAHFARIQQKVNDIPEPQFVNTDAALNKPKGKPKRQPKDSNDKNSKLKGGAGFVSLLTRPNEQFGPID